MLFILTKNLKNNDVISHSNRVFFTIIKFIKYYNDSINQNIVIDIKNNFKRRYSGYYRSILKANPPLKPKTNVLTAFLNLVSVFCDSAQRQSFILPPMDRPK